ncbi:MAG: glycoside hydrolase family 127 protein, partial [Muribaculaceae bacterium]|nr:glycoside hydrolase family 127 protein [Muribaculaceae bacterium]
IGGNSVREHFHPSDNFGSMIESEQGPETCNTYNMMRLTRMLYATSADPAMIDYYEQALYNHILSSINPVQGGFVYFTPMRSGHYRVYSQPHTSFWCCVGSGLENHARYGEMIYGHDDNTLYVNLFIPSTVRWGETTITQTTEFPYCDSTELTVTGTGTPRRFTLKLRVPGWSDGDKVRLSVNGSPQHSPAIDNGYIAITREWSDGDKVSMTMPMTLRATGLPDGSEYYSFMYGPIVLASCLGQERQDGIFADDSRGGHIASGPKTPLHEIPAIIGSRDSLLHHIVRDYSQPLAFTLHGVSDNRYDGMKLQPFFEIHQCRYMVYWQVCTSDPRLTSGHDIESGERYREALDAMTVDMVRCGEQQPESDHFITYENSMTGNDNGISWREAEGRFSYKLTNRDGKASSLRIAYTPDPTRSARITIGDCQPVPLSGADGIFLIELPINQHRAQQVDVTIESDSGNTTPRISEIRLVTVSEE